MQFCLFCTGRAARRFRSEHISERFNLQAKFRANDTGFVILGVMNFDGAGNLTGPYTAHISASSNGKPAGSLTGTFTGTYVSNPDRYG
jgi:hypothetical protein